MLKKILTNIILLARELIRGAFFALVAFIIIVAILASATLSARGEEEYPSTPQPSRTLYVRHFATDTKEIEASADTLLLMAQESKDPIHIIINSRGGQLDAATDFITVIKDAQRLGVSIICTVRGQAYSAAFWILSMCSERRIQVGSTLMFHPVRYVFAGQVVLTEEELKGLAQEATANNLVMFLAVKTATRKSSTWVMTAFHQERVFTASEFLLEAPKFGVLIP